jgi:hypothetical protein
VKRRIIRRPVAVDVAVGGDDPSPAPEAVKV